VGALCVVEEGCEVAAGAVLVAQVYLGPHVRVGVNSVLHPGVSVYERCTIGAECTLESGVVIGADGFGFEHTGDHWEKIPQRGTVTIGDHVDIGPNTVVDRARFGETRIDDGAKLDGQVFVSHNSVVGAHAMMCGQSGIAGSSILEPHVVMGAQAGVAGHATLKTGVRLSAGGGAYSSIVEPGDYVGVPARPRSEAMRRMAAPTVVERMRARVAQLEQRLAELEARASAGESTS
jgi:UDP-3-O-[3-hydroxymyristoyl] glucosamine N-acyltransferase